MFRFPSNFFKNFGLGGWILFLGMQFGCMGDLDPMTFCLIFVCKYTYATKSMKCIYYVEFLSQKIFTFLFYQNKNKIGVEGLEQGRVGMRIS